MRDSQITSSTPISPPVFILFTEGTAFPESENTSFFDGVTVSEMGIIDLASPQAEGGA